MIFCNESIRDSVNSATLLKINDAFIPIVTQCKNLGLTVDSKLKFEQHITSKLKLSYASLKLIYAQRYFLSPDVKKMLCDSLVLSNFNHCDIVYGPCLYIFESGRIKKLQNSCVRLIFGIRKYDHISIKFRKTKWLNMVNRRNLHFACLSQKLFNMKTPPYLHEKLTFRTDVHNLNIRFKSILRLPRFLKASFKSSFTYNFSK